MSGMGEITFAMFLLVDAVCMLGTFLDLKGQSKFANIVLPFTSSMISFGLSTACDTGVLAGTEVATMPYWGVMFQGHAWAMLIFALYAFGSVTLLQMRR